MTRILAIDPGLRESGWILLRRTPDERLDVLRHGITPNKDWGLFGPPESPAKLTPSMQPDVVAIEYIAHMGVSAGGDVLDSMFWTGRLVERLSKLWRPAIYGITRMQVKMAMCGSPRARDKDIRAACIEWYGPDRSRSIGTKASPGPLYGVKSHIWSALAVGLTLSQTQDRGAFRKFS